MDKIRRNTTREKKLAAGHSADYRARQKALGIPKGALITDAIAEAFLCRAAHRRPVQLFSEDHPRFARWLILRAGWSGDAEAIQKAVERRIARHFAKRARFDEARPHADPNEDAAHAASQT